jgi:hypothetical protein
VVVCQSYWLPDKWPLSIVTIVFSELVTPVPGYILSFHEVADTVSFPRWYARTAGSLLRRINLQMETVYLKTPLYGFRHYSFILVVHYRSTRTGEHKSPPAEPHAGGRHWYDGVLPGTPKGSLATLLSPPQCHATLGTIPHTLASVDLCPVRPLMTWPPPPPPWQGRQGLDFGGDPSLRTLLWLRFQVFTAARMKITVFWDLVPCSIVEIDRRFRGAYCFHHHGALMMARCPRRQSSSCYD